MRHLVALPVIVPLLAAGLSIGIGRWRAAQRVIGFTTLTGLLASSIVLLVGVDDRGPIAVQAGGWPAPVGITLIADRLAMVMVVIALVVLLAVLAYGSGQGHTERDHVGFHPVYLILTAGACLAFLTGDLFNMFVSFEMMLTASYVLITLGGRPAQVRSGMTYVVVSLVASTFFLITLAFVYAATGTVNLADLSGRLQDVPDGVRSAIGLLLLVVFGIKSAVFPLYFWLPDSYPTAPSPVTAIFAGLLTKVGVYALIRSQTLLLPDAAQPKLLILVVAAATMLIGVLGAIAQDDVKRILSFHIVSQIGYMVFGLGLFTIAGLAGAVLYIVHHIVVKTTLFLVAGLIELREGTGRLARIDGMVRSAPAIAVLFALPALSLAGIPPFSGFVAKLALVRAGIDDGQHAVVVVSLAVSALTLFSMTKIWGNVFWGEPVEAARAAGADVRPPQVPAAMYAATGALAAVSVAIAVFSGPLFELAERTAADLLGRQAYLDAVLGDGWSR